MTMRLASVALVLGAALADAAGQHALAYYSLVAAVPLVALAALSALGDVLDGSAAEPHDRGIAVLSAARAPVRPPRDAPSGRRCSRKGRRRRSGSPRSSHALAIFAVQALRRRERRRPARAAPRRLPRK